MYCQWDDHEVTNDFGGQWAYWNSRTQERPGYPNLVEIGRETMFLHSPIDRNPLEPYRIYRKFNWGADVDLFILDQRTYRSRNDLPDTAANRKTLLGAEQLEWLKENLRASTATWKIISADVPLGLATGNTVEFGRDSWANGTVEDFRFQTGFERELLDLMRWLDDHRIQNMVWVVTDVHYAAKLRYELDPNGDGTPLIFHELVCGPIAANRGNGPFAALDPTLNPTILYGEGGILNFGYVRIEPGADGRAYLTADVRGEDGEPRPGSRLVVAPQ